MFLPWRPVLLAGGSVPAISTSVTAAETTELRRMAAQTTVAQWRRAHPGDADEEDARFAPRAAAILEVGSAFGYSAIAMALANPLAHVTAVDPHAGELPGSLPVMRANLAAYDVADRVTVVAEPSQTALPRLELGAYDLVFIDADHREPAVTHDVTWALKLLRPGGMLACHDLDEGSCPGVRAALDKLFDHPVPAVDTLFTYQT